MTETSPVLPRSVLRIALVTVEATSALSLGAGGEDGTFDMMLRKDANGLPALPGSSLAGVLRNLWERHYPDDPAKRLFGSMADEATSRVEVGWGHCHSAADAPVVGPRLAGDDPVLQAWTGSRAPGQAVRERVRLTGRGAAAHRGQFDRLVALAGTRFTFELTLWSEEGPEGEADWARLLGLLRSPLFRMGGAVRAGLGRLKLERLEADAFHLGPAKEQEGQDWCPAKERERLASCRVGIHGLRRGTLPVLEVPDITPPPEYGTPREISLRAEDLLRMGGAQGPLHHRAGAKPPDLTFAQEKVWVWPKTPGEAPRLEPRLLVAASGIKGALRHRVAFHHFRAQGVWAENLGEAPRLDDIAEQSEAVRRLFGEVKKGTSGGRAGLLLIEDVQPEWPAAEAVQVVTHNSIDRFTGGTRRGVLFTEEMVRHLRLRVSLRILPGACVKALAALDAALEDLRCGWLAIGAASGRGHGVLREEAAHDA